MLEELEVKCLGKECEYISQRGLMISHTNVCAKTVVKCLNKACAEEVSPAWSDYGLGLIADDERSPLRPQDICLRRAEDEMRDV
jgi:hypothetical protein